MQLVVEPRSGGTPHGCPAADARTVTGAPRPPAATRRYSPVPFLAGPLHDVCDVVDLGGEPHIPTVLGPLAEAFLRRAARGYADLLADGTLPADWVRLALDDEFGHGPSVRLGDDDLAALASRLPGPDLPDRVVLRTGWRLRAYGGPDGRVEVRRLRLSGGAGPDLRWALTAAHAVAVTRDAPRVRVVEVLCAEGAARPVLDVDAATLRERWAREVVPDLLALAPHGRRHEPGGCCAGCHWLADCLERERPAALRPVRLPLAAPPEQPEAVALSPADLRAGEACPAQGLARLLRLPQDRDGDAEAGARGRERGSAVHAWLAAAHARGRPCADADLADADLADAAGDAFDDALPFLAAHVPVCPLGRDAGDPPVHRVAEGRFAVLDDDSGVLLAVRPDLVSRYRAGTVVREVKTAAAPAYRTAEQAVGADMAAAAYLAVLAAGAFGPAEAVEWEVLTPEGALLLRLDATDRGLVAAATARVAAAAAGVLDPLRTGLPVPTRPSATACAACAFTRWCRDGRALPQRPVAAAADR